MKHLFTKFSLLLISLVLCFSANAQSLSEVLNNTETPIFYYGIDFTKKLPEYKWLHPHEWLFHSAA